MPATEYVILVDGDDNEIGIAEKLSAHAENQLHRAFSVFVFKKEPQLQLLLQQRALGKYHSQGLWTNTCCSHPRSGEAVVEAGERRLAEEMGVRAKLQAIGSFHYNVALDNGLYENEIDHVLIGFIDDAATIQPHPDEVHAYQWLSLEQLEKALTATPNAFTPWLLPALQVVKKYVRGL